MTIYTPNKWVVLAATNKDVVTYKVFATWYGSLTSGESWKLSSGNSGVLVDEDFWVFPQFSGSTYRCHSKHQGMTMYTQGILKHWQLSLLEANMEATIEVVPKDFDFRLAFSK